MHTVYPECACAVCIHAGGYMHRCHDCKGNARALQTQFTAQAIHAQGKISSSRTAAGKLSAIHADGNSCPQDIARALQEGAAACAVCIPAQTGRKSRRV